MSDGGDVGDIEDPAVERAVQQLLTRDEARIISIAALVIIAIGLLLTLGWIVLEWRSQTQLSGGDRVSSLTGSSTDDADLVDRIIRVEQDGFVVSLSVLVIAVGCGLRLFAGRLISQRPEIDELDDVGDDVVHEVELDPEI